MKLSFPTTTETDLDTSGRSFAEELQTTLDEIRADDGYGLGDDEALNRHLATFARFGANMVHMVRFAQAVSTTALVDAYERENGSSYGAGLVESAALRNRLDEGTLRLYMRCVRITDGSVVRFYDYLVSAGEYKSQARLRQWCQVDGDEDLMPPEKKKQLRARTVERAGSEIEEAIAGEDDPEARDTMVVGVLQTVGVALDLSKTGQEDAFRQETPSENVSHETIGTLTGDDTGLGDDTASLFTFLSLESVTDQICTWADGQFPESTLYSLAKHLLEEAEELIEALERGGDVGEELVDIYFLLIQLMRRTIDHIPEALFEKLQTNQGRTWSKPDPDGVSRHLKNGHYDVTKQPLN